MACDLDSDACRTRHIAARLDGAKPDGTDYEARCPVCGHGGFRISRPTLTKMRNMWTCNCKTCNGGNGCLARDVRAAMLQRKILPWCLGSYIGKGKPEVDLEQLRKIAQTVEDIINCYPAFSAADMVMALAEARGDKIPDEYKECAAYGRSLGMSRANSYNVAEKWTGGPEQSP